MPENASGRGPRTEKPAEGGPSSRTLPSTKAKPPGGVSRTSTPGSRTLLVFSRVIE